MNIKRSRKSDGVESRFIGNNRKRLVNLIHKLEAVDTAIRSGELDTSSSNVGGDSRADTESTQRRET